MKEAGHISTLMLERYHLGEVTTEERKLVEAELAGSAVIRGRYESLEDSNRDFRRLYPWEKSALVGFTKTAALVAPGRDQIKIIRSIPFPRGRILRGLCAATVLLCVLFPSLHYMRKHTFNDKGITTVEEGGSDRLKGTEIKHELSIYLRDTPVPIPADEGRKLSDGTLLRAGNTIQLAYTTPPGDQYYGVIFSIDGRSLVTLHYPYRRLQNPVLTAGRRTFLSEAYTLDDAPAFEIFFMVTSTTPLSTESILEAAEVLALELSGEIPIDSIFALVRSGAFFEGCDVEVVTIKK